MASPRGGSTGTRASRAVARTITASPSVMKDAGARSWLMTFQIADLVAEQCEGDAAAVGLAARERFRHVQHLLGFHARRHRRLEWIDDRFDQRRTVGEHHRFERRPRLFRRLTPEADRAARLRELDEVDRLELDAILRVAEEHHLFP